MAGVGDIVHEESEPSEADPGRVLVTGASGLVGHALVRLLAGRRGVLAAARRADATAPGVEWIVGDLRKPVTWARMPGDVTEVVHLAARVPAPDVSDDAHQDNLAMAEQLLQRSRSWPRLRAVVAASTIAVYGPHARALDEALAPAPESAYARSKLAAEGILDRIEARVTHVRLSSVYGPRQPPHGVLPTFLRLAHGGRTLRYHGDGSRTQDFIHVDDAAMALDLALRIGSAGVYAIGSGTSTSMRELAEACVSAASPTSARVERADAPETAPSVRVSIAKARSELGYDSRIPLSEGLKRCLAAVP